MNQVQILKLINEEKYDTLLSEYHHTFEYLEQIKTDLMAGHYYTRPLILEALGFCSGYYGDLIVVSKLLETQVDILNSKEIIKSANAESKNVTLSKSQAITNTSLVRQVNAVFTGYVKMSESFTSAFQSMLKSSEREYQIAGKE